MLAISPLAATVGYFDSDVCVDSSGLEECYEQADSDWADCVNNNCESQNIDCTNVCSCIRTRDQIDCAGRHCWNQVYSCEYQLTAGDIGTYCLNPRFDELPFYPPLDDAPGSCSCNQAKLVTSLYRTSNETETCGANGEEIVQQLTSNDEIQVFTQACLCRSYSGFLSAFWDICPDTDPSLLGADDIYQSLFYEPGNFPANGTKTTSISAGSIISPISGATYTWTYYNGVERVVTVASADAKPTGKSSGSGDDDESDESNVDEEDAASLTVPRPVFLAALML